MVVKVYLHKAAPAPVTLVVPEGQYPKLYAEQLAVRGFWVGDTFYAASSVARVVLSES
jgi:hypothetical protein